MPSEIASWPSFTREEADAVARTLLSNKVNYWTGQECRIFETEFAAWCGTGKAIALTNGTVALDLALKALGIGPGDEVIVTPRTFIASVSTVVNCGATPIFADVDGDSGNIGPASITPQISSRTKAIIPVHLGGWPCDMAPIMDLGIPVIEDCAQAHGAKIDGRSVGSIGQIGAWSFCQDKIMTTGGEGGMVTTDDPDLWSRMWSFKDHGKNWSAVYERQHPPGFRWIHESFGTNWRMLEMQATIGRIQLTRMPDWSKRRREIAAELIASLEKHRGSVRVPVPGANMVHAYYRLYAYVRQDGLRSGWDRDRIIARMNELGAPVFQGSCSEVYRERAFEGTGLGPKERLPVARELGETSLCFLTHPTITDEQLKRICNALETTLTEASR